MAEAVAAPVAHAVKKDSTMLLILGVLTVILGVFAMMAPGMTGMTVAVMVGILLIIAGVARGIFAFKAQSWGKGILAFLLGLLTLIVGFYMVTNPGVAVASLTLFLAAYFIVDGIFEIIWAFRLRPIKGWGWTLFSGIVALALGVMIWRQFPVSGIWAVGTLAGIHMIFGGSSVASVCGAARSAAKDASAA